MINHKCWIWSNVAYFDNEKISRLPSKSDEYKQKPKKYIPLSPVKCPVKGNKYTWTIFEIHPKKYVNKNIKIRVYNYVCIDDRFTSDSNDY